MGTMEGRVALVTGASRGIGRAIALALAARGAAVVAAARGRPCRRPWPTRFVAAGGQAEAVALDVTDADVDRRGGRRRRWSGIGRIDILVNNAGITRDQLMLRMKREDWDAVHRDEPDGGVRVRAGGAASRWSSSASGRIINITSVVGPGRATPGQANYAASKAGLIGFTKALALEVASRNITVNAVAPGLDRHRHDAGDRRRARRRTGRRGFR